MNIEKVLGYSLILVFVLHFLTSCIPYDNIDFIIKDMERSHCE